MKFEQIVSDNYVPQLVSLLHAAYQADEKLGIHFHAARVNAADVRKHLQSTPTFALLSSDGEQVLATVSVRLPWSANPGPGRFPHLGWVATNPAYQGHGLAKQLITAVIQQFVVDKLRAPAVTLGTAKEHPWLIQAYQNLGFEITGEAQLFPDHKTVYLRKTLGGNASEL